MKAEDLETEVVKTPSLATRTKGAGGICRGATHIVGSRASRCLYSARWEVVSDDGRTLRVCRLHANKAERAGELEVVR